MRARAKVWQMDAISEDRLIAEQAADWVGRLKRPSARENAEFMRWVRRSPIHVREMLMALTLDAELDRIDPDRKIDLDALIAQSSSNVVRINQREEREPPVGRRAGARGMWFAGVAVAAVLLLVLGELIRK